VIHPALRYLAWRQAVGGVRHMLRQIRRPRYFVPLLFVLAYFSLIMVPSLLDIGAPQEESGSAFTPLLGPIAALFVCLNLFTAAKRPAPAFTLPEAAQLFVLPISRRQLVAYTLLRPQLGLVTASAFLALLWASQSWSANPLLMFAGVFAGLNLLQFVHLFSALLLNRLKRSGVPGFVMYLPAALMLAWVALPLLVFAPPGAGGFTAWAHSVGEGPAGAIHAPLRLLAGVFGFGGTGPFLAGLAAVLGLCVALFGAAMALVAPFEETAMANAEAAGMKIDAVRRGGLMGLKLQNLKGAKTTGLPLSSTGPPLRAALWASVIGEWRAGPWRMFLLGVLMYTLFLAVLGFARVGNQGWTIAAVLPAAVILPILVGITRTMPTSLRVEFEKLETLKCLPLDGRRLLRGRVWGAALVGVAPLGLLALAIGVAALGASHWSIPWVLPVILSGLPALAALLALLCAVESALVVTVPAWMVSARGDLPLDQMGRAMAAFAAQWLLMSALIVPAVTIGVGVGVGAGLGGLREWAAVPGLLAGATALIAECELVLVFAGRRYDLMDATDEAA